MSPCVEHRVERGFVRLTDETLGAFLSAERAALIVVEPGCSWCEGYLTGIEIAQTLGHLRDLPIGVLVLDDPETENFARDNEWIVQAEGYPYTALYRDGLRVDSFVAFNAFSLIDRLEYLAFLPVPAPRVQRTPSRLAA